MVRFDRQNLRRKLTCVLRTSLDVASGSSGSPAAGHVLAEREKQKKREETSFSYHPFSLGSQQPPQNPIQEFCEFQPRDEDVEAMNLEQLSLTQKKVLEIEKFKEKMGELGREVDSKPLSQGKS